MYMDENILIVDGSRTLEATQDYVIVKRFPEVESMGAIVIPSQHREENPLAEVISVGPGIQRMDGTWPDPPIESGDVVIVARFMGTKLRIEHEDETGNKVYDECAIVKWGDVSTVVNK